MLRRVVFVLVVCSCVGIAFGAAVKIKSFVNLGEPNPEADGMAVLNWVAGTGQTILQLVVSDFEPYRDSIDSFDVDHVKYDVILRKPDGVVVELFRLLETDQHGHGTLHVKLPTWAGDCTGADVEIYVGYLNPNVPEELRAVGWNPN